MSSKVVFKKSATAAGGWGALWSCAQALMQSTSLISGIKTALKVNQPDGFAGPGAAFASSSPSPSIAVCENGVKALASEMTEKRVTEAFFQEYTVSELRTFSDFDLEDQGRLTVPLRYNKITDRYNEISWAEAFKEIGAELRALKKRGDGVFYTSGRISNEAAFLYQLLGRILGVTSFPSSTDFGHEASGIALEEAIGTRQGTVRLEDFEKADAIFVFGLNPGTTHPLMMPLLRDAAARGAQVVSFNPLKECGMERFSDPHSRLELMRFGSSPVANHFFTPKPGGDMAAVRGMAKAIFAWDYERILTHSILDRVFIDENCGGFEEFEKIAELTTWKEIEDQSGLTRDQIEAAALIYVQADRPIITWGTGICQHKHSVATIREFMNLLFLRGKVCKAGAGAAPISGNINSSGLHRMGVTSHPSETFLDRLQQVFDFEAETQGGARAAETVKLMNERKLRVFFGLGGNFARAAPDTQLTEHALRQCRLTVNIASKLNRTHLMTGALSYILPCLGHSEVDIQRTGEQMVSIEDMFSKLHGSTGVNQPAAEGLMSEPAIISALARATMGNKHVNWSAFLDDYDVIREKIEEVVPELIGLNTKIRAPEGFTVPRAVSLRQWKTAKGRAEFSSYSLPLATVAQKASKASKLTFILQGLRSPEQFNTSIYKFEDRYRGVYASRKVVFINPADMRRAGLAPGDTVDITNASDDKRQRKLLDFQVVPFNTPPGCIASYFPEVNAVLPAESVADQSGTPTAKSIAVTLSKSRRRA